MMNYHYYMYSSYFTQLLMRNYYFMYIILCFLMRSIFLASTDYIINVLSPQRLMRKYDYIRISLVLHGRKYDYKRLCITSDS
jgi:hypothetical protein